MRMHFFWQGAGHEQRKDVVVVRLLLADARDLD